MYVGLDIGYSGLKVAYSSHTHTEPSKINLPATAMPFESGYFSSNDGHIVRIGNEEWQTGIDPIMLVDQVRYLTEDYTSTKAYLALAYTALKLTNANVIECLGTGLPVGQFFNKSLKENLIQRLQGRHEVAKNRMVTVKDVKIYPQPAGSFASMLLEKGTQRIDTQGRTILVIDVGYFSVDSVVLRNNSPAKGFASTSLNAMSRILEEADRIIVKKHMRSTAMPGMFVTALESALRKGHPTIPVRSFDVDIMQPMDQAAEEVAQRAIVSIQRSVRALPNLNMVVLTGGGAKWYAPWVEKHFPDIQVRTLYNAPMANARGFWGLVIAGK